MRVLIIDQIGFGLAFADRCARAGHAVRLFIKPGPMNNPRTGEGFKSIQRIDNWLSSVKWADLIWCTSNDAYIPKLDAMRGSQGIKFYGPSVKSADLEIKRAQGMKFFEKHGIPVPSYKQFNSLNDAEAHVRKTEKRYVFKVLGDNNDKSLSYCSKSPADMIARLQRWQKMRMNPKGPVILQEFIAGVEFAVSVWMGTKGFVSPPNENFEHKKFMAGNCGPNTGETGTVQKYVDNSVLAEHVLFPLEKAFVELGHLGALDVNCIVDEKGKAWPLEFTCRTGWPCFNIMMAQHKGDPVQWMLDACNGKRTLEVSKQVACGLVLAIPDYPYNDAFDPETDGIPIYGVTSKNRSYIAPQSVRIDRQPVMDGEKVVEKDSWTTSDNYLAVVTGLGKTVEKACERAYATVKELHVPELIYRDDIGERLKDDLPKLQAFGYAAEFEYA